MHNNNLVNNVFFFDSMITPKIITFVYWLMLLGMVIFGLVTMFNRFFGGFWLGLAIIVGGAISVRIWCELLIVLFKINDHARRIAETNTHQPQAPGDAHPQGFRAALSE